MSADFCVTVLSMKFLFLAFSFLFLVLPSFVYAGDAPTTFAGLASMLVGLINTATGLLITLGLVVYFWGISTSMSAFEENAEKRKAYFLWGFIAIFVMVSIWGIVAILQNTLFAA